MQSDNTNSVASNKPSQLATSCVEFATPSTDHDKRASPLDFERDDVLQYIQEMCATLAFMSQKQNCANLSAFLLAAAREAEYNRSEAACSSAQTALQR